MNVLNGMTTHKPLLKSISCMLLLLGLIVLVMPATAQTVEPEGPPATQAVAPDRASAHEYLRAGDKAFKRQDYASAELEYRRASEREPSFKSLYNLGLSLTQQGRPAEAAEAFERAERYAEELSDQADANYNAGTAQLQAENLKKSVERYVDALRINPNDIEAKQNLSEVLKQLRLQQPPPPQEQPQDQQESEDQDQSEEQQQQEQQLDQEQQQQDSKGQPSEEDESNEDENGGQPAEEVDVDREEAERLLQLAREQERKTQEKLKLDSSQPNRPAKDW